MNVKVEKKSRWDFKRNMISLMVAAAMAVSWGAVSHVSGYLHQHSRSISSSSASAKRSKRSAFTPDTLTTETGMIQAPPPPKAPAKPSPVPILAFTAKTRTPAVAATPPATTAAKSSPTSLVTALAAKVGVNITEDKGVSITQSKIDTGFITKVEGSVLKGYVPLAGSTNSGVTIADGFDLGQMHRSEFNQLPITTALKNKLMPYVGLTKFKAVAFLKAHPLTISQDELVQLNVIAANKILKPLVAVYNKESGKSFMDLPAGAQTAIFSYAYQHGPGFMHRSSGKALWNSFISQNWQKASTLLKGARMYAPRRHLEAQLLDNIS